MKNLNSLLYDEFKEKEPIVDPWILEGTITSIYAGRGIGKTYLALLLLVCIGAGLPFLGQPTRRRRCLYVDGEMGYQSLSGRTRSICGALSHDIPADNIQFDSFEDYKSGVVPNLADTNTHAEWEEKFKYFDVIIIDNLDTCTFPLTPQDSDLAQWIRMRPWLIKLRSQGKCIVLIDHSNKTGTQYGTSKKGNTVDVEMSLTKPEFKFQTEAENAFKLEFQKGRHLRESQTAPLWIEVFDSGLATSFQSQPYNRWLKDSVHNLQETGMKDRDICDALGISKQALLYIKTHIKVLDEPTTTNKGDDDEVVFDW